MKINIILSTYNGEKFLPEFLKSLENQSFKEWILFVRDDNSQDNTLSILEEFKKKRPQKVYLIKDTLGNLGACKSFLTLLKETEGDYFMFADQDDIWLPDKIELNMIKMLKLENIYGKESPILIHSDLIVVDKNLNILAKSLWKYQRTTPQKRNLNYLLIQNNVTGCTVMINKALKGLVNTIPNKAIMHDWWLALLASAFGVIDYIEKPLVFYRQHESQDIGARKYSLSYFLKRFAKNPKDAFISVFKTVEQAKEFFEIYKNLLPKEKKDIILSYLEIFNRGILSRPLKICKGNFLKHGIIRNIGFIFTLTVLWDKYARPKCLNSFIPYR
ncbi:MAG: glycosyltransferase family 2 protein [Spirochaetia bacterium]|nr:glycosyltransferase family 2 protein [Spirochaetota bacterium]MDW8113199.1 glycosyltransferase family 2 protein [Spirochaetia bacterium]